MFRLGVCGMGDEVVMWKEIGVARRWEGLDMDGWCVEMSGERVGVGKMRNRRMGWVELRLR